MPYTAEQQIQHIREIQEYLRTLSFMDEQYPQVAVDGIYKPETTAAVRAFQRINQLPITGNVDTATWNRLVKEYNDVQALLSEPSGISPFPSPSFVLRAGDRGNIVYILQIMLNEIGEVFRNLVPVPIDGVYEESTVSRVRELQRINGFEQNGEVDKAFWDTLARLYNADLS